MLATVYNLVAIPDGVRAQFAASLPVIVMVAGGFLGVTLVLAFVKWLLLGSQSLSDYKSNGYR